MDFSKIKPDFANEIIREAEALLGGQVTLATSADQRAAVMASVFAAAGAALAAAVITIGSSSASTADVLPIVFGGVVSSGMFLVGAACCVKATMPVGFYLPGAEPEDFAEDVAAGSSLSKIQAEQASHFQERIVSNNAVLADNAKWFRRGASSGIAAPPTGFLTWLVIAAAKSWLG